MTIKELFEKAENGTMTYDQFKAAAKESGANFTDLAEGKYVSKQKYDDDIKDKETTISTLNTTITGRDSDLADLKKKLEDAGTDASKLTELNTKLTTLQSQYDTDTKNFQDKLAKQAYEFAVKDYANTQKFTSNAAKRDFISSMIKENLKMNDKNEIMGASDFQKSYSEANSDAFVVERPAEQPPAKPQPTFVQPTPGASTPSNNANEFSFNFAGVRAKEN